MNKNLFLSILLLIFISSLYRNKYTLILLTLALQIYNIRKKNYKTFFITFITIFILTTLIIDKKGSLKIKENYKNNSKKTKDSSSVNQVKDESAKFTLKTKDYKQLQVCLRSLLESEYIEKNKDSIDEIIKTYQIKDIYDLSNKILNKEQLPKYNNFLEKITCIDDDGNVDYINTTDNINFLKLYAFSELIRIYTFSLEYVIHLINEKNILSVCELAAKRQILYNFNPDKFGYGYELFGLEFYLNEKQFKNTYYDILIFLEIDKNLGNDKDVKNLTFKEKLTNYRHPNSQVVKDINSIIVLLDQFNIFNKTLLSNEEPNEELFITLLKSVDLEKPHWDNKYFKKYNLKQQIIKKINEFTKTHDFFRTELNEKFTSQNKPKYFKEEIILNQNKSKIDDDFLKTINLSYILRNFSKVILDIIEDLVNLYNNRCNYDCPNPDNKAMSQLFYYLGNIFSILRKEGRMMYVGILIFFISIMLYFIEITK